MSSRANQHRFLNGVLIPQFLDAMGIPVTKDSVLDVKEMFKKYLKVHSTAALSDRDMSLFIQAFLMLAAREFSIELTHEFAEKTMRQLLNETDKQYHDDL